MEQLGSIAPMIIFIVLVIVGMWFFVIKRHRPTIERRNTIHSGQSPQQIQNTLTRDEVVEKAFGLKGCLVYATGKRLLVLKGRTIRDYDYVHISSVAYSSKRYWWLIAVGVILIIVGVLFRPLMVILGGIGLVLAICGAVLKSEWVEVNVVGVSEVPKFKGPRQRLDSLLQIIREKRDAQSVTGQAVTKAIDSIEAIRKLSELRDDGIITEEEFEEKKSKLLESSG